MDGRRGKISAVVHTIGVKTVLITLMVLLITLATAVYVEKRVYESNKKVLLLQGELLVKESTLEYIRYLHTHENIIELVGNTVNTLLSEGAGPEAIGKYITEQTQFIIGSLDRDTTGLYGLFEDVYVDGAGWVPDSSYVPKQRPWYWQTITTDHEVVFITPYVDAIEGGWYNVSMINADIWYGPLQRTVVIFIIILIVLVLLIVGAFVRLSGKNMKLQKLNNWIYQEKRRGEALQALSETDRMTGLNDRVSGKRKVEEILRAGHGGAFLEMDIDHFKMINDTYGHQAGDAVIVELTNVLKSMFRNNDVTIRLCGDEFGVFAVGITTRDLARTVVERLFSRLDQITVPQLEGGRFSISVGAAICPGNGQDSFDSLYARSDAALYISKKATGNCLTFSEL